MKSVRRGAISAACIVLLSASGAWAQVGVGSEDRVVFYGDGPIFSRGFGYMVESFVRVKYPASKCRFWHVGVLGSGYARIETANQQFEDLVAPLKPTVVVLFLGLGEGEMKRHDPGRVAKAAEEFEKLVDRCLAVGASVYVVTPPPPTVSKKNIFAVTKYDETVGKIGKALAEVAEKKGAAVLDWFGALVDLQRAMPDWDLTGSDGLAPSPLSQSVAANLILQAWKMDPVNVSVSVDWAAGTASTSHGGVVPARISDDTMRLSLQNFPMPFHTGWRKSAFREEFACAEFCRIMLKIDNLPDGKVLLSEPESRRKPIEIQAEQLREGYNLATKSPLTAASAVNELSKLIEKKNEAYGSILWFRRYMAEEPPEPEHLESYKTHLLSREQYHEGSAKIIQRTPRAVNMSIDMRLVSGGSAP